MRHQASLYMAYAHCSLLFYYVIKQSKCNHYSELPTTPHTSPSNNTINEMSLFGPLKELTIRLVSLTLELKLSAKGKPKAIIY